MLLLFHTTSDFVQILALFLGVLFGASLFVVFLINSGEINGKTPCDTTECDSCPLPCERRNTNANVQNQKR